MIAHSQKYSYDLIGGLDDYGFPSIQQNVGEISMSIYVRYITNTDNPLYTASEYIGYTFDDVSDSMIIHYGDMDLKVTSVQPTSSRWNMAYMTRVGK